MPDRIADGALTVTWPEPEPRTLATRVTDLVVSVPLLVVAAIVLNLAVIGLAAYEWAGRRRGTRNGAPPAGPGRIERSARDATAAPLMDQAA